MADAARTGAGRTRSGFGPTVLGGLAAGAVAALVGAREWVEVEGGSGDEAFAAAVSAGGDLTAPPVTATALVLLASWGVVLVSRGRVRRAVAWLGLVASAAVLALAVLAWLTLPDDAARDLANLDVEVSRSPWAHLGVLAGLAAVVTSLLAVRGVRRWPEMGRRYDAPATAAPVAAAAPEDQSSLELWKALDEGRDPTDGPPPA